MNFPRILLLLLPLTCSAQAIQGSVQNGTTGKPESGHQVTLFTRSGEQASSTTDENGRFKIELTANLSPHSLAVLRVPHDGVEYFQPVGPGRATNVTVYDSSSQVSGISGYLSVLQFQVKGKQLQVTELDAFNNASSPPITSSNSGNLVLSMPEAARVQPATIATPDGGTFKLPLVLIPGQKAEYKIDFPMKPGLTKYAINYQIPYDGKLAFRRRTQYPMRQIGIIVPDSMHFHSLGARVFSSAAGPAGTQERLLSGLNANESFAFELSGTGVLSQYFSPLNPAEPPALAKSKALTVPWQQEAPPGPNTTPSRARSSFLESRILLAAGVLALAGLLFWSMMLRKAPRM